jgi:hypothetical protein
LEGLDQLKNPMTSSGIEPATLRLEQSASTNYATACPLLNYEGESINRSQSDIKLKTCDIPTGKNIYFSKYPPPTLVYFSYLFTSASKNAA